MKIKSSITLLAMSTFLCTSAHALTVIGENQQKDLNVTIYNANIALVNDTRTSNLTSGKNHISYESIADMIIPESALLSGGSVVTTEQNFNYDLIDTNSLLAKSVGENVILETVNQNTGEKQQTEAKLIAYNNNQPILKINGKIVTNPQGTILLNNLPKGLISKPSLNMNINSPSNQETDLTLSYLTRGLSWTANYVANLNEDENSMGLNGFITLNNQSSSTFKNADLKLVAGDVAQVRHVRRSMMKAMAVDAMQVNSFDEAMPTVEDVADFYVYTLPSKTTVLPKQEKQVALLSKTNVAVQKDYVFDNALKPYNANPLENIKARVVYQFDNNKGNTLGIALPKGVIRFYKNTKDNESVYVGEAFINHTPNKATVKLPMGEAFDIFANAKLTKQNQIGDTQFKTYEIIFKNGSTKDKTVTVYENFNGDWQITQTSMDYIKETANRVKWRFNVPANQETTLTYQVAVENKHSHRKY